MSMSCNKIITTDWGYADDKHDKGWLYPDFYSLRGIALDVGVTTLSEISNVVVVL